MPECKECGESFDALNDSSLCTACARETAKPVKLPSAAIMTKEGYEKAVERANHKQPAPPLPKRRSSLGALIGVVLFFGWIALVAWSYHTFGLTTPFIYLVLCGGFFALGLAMIFAGRVTFGRAEPSDKLEPTAARSLHLIVGVFWIIPLLLFIFYMAKNSAVPTEGQLWFVGIMLGIAFAMQLVCARAYTPVD
jgi:hypothetical protein